MARKLQLKRGLQANLPTLAEAELGFTTDTKKLYIGSANGNIDLTLDVSGNAATATKLQTARTINGVSFNGTANITVADATKAPIAHASTATTYGPGTTANYGHVKTINALTQTSHLDGTALSAYQGKLLNDKVVAKVSMVTSTAAPTATLAANVLHCVYA